MIALGQQLEDMVGTDAWKFVDKYMHQKEERIKRDLTTKTFTDICEVRALQEKLKAYSEIRGEIADRIRRGKEAKQKLEAGKRE